MFVSETYTIEDIYYYANWSKLTSDTTHWSKYTGVSGRNIYNWLSNFTNDIEVSFKFKDSVPNNFLIGFGKFNSSGGQIKSMFFNNNGTKQVWWSEGTGSQENKNVNYSQSISKDTIFKLRTTNLHQVGFYLTDLNLTTKTTYSSFPLYLRIDDFTSTPMELEYLKVKKL